MVLLGEAVSIVAGMPLFIIIFSMLMFLNIGLIWKKKVWKWYLIFPMFTLIAFFRMEWAGRESSVDSDTQYHIEGKVNKIVEKEGYRQIYLYGAAASAMNDDDMITVKGVIINDSDMKQEILPGDLISCDVFLKQYEKAGNPGNFDARRYYASLNIDCYAWTDAVRLEKQADNPWIQGIFRLKKRLLSAYEQIGIGEDAGIYSSIVLGDKTTLDAHVKKLYQMNGMAHILAISGLHVSILGMGFYKILRKCCIPFFSCFIMSFLVILSYGIMTGSSVSTVRAIVMFLMGIFGDVLGRTYDILSALGLSAVILILIYPKIIYNSGFLLSFLAVVGVVVVKPALDYLFRTGDLKGKFYGNILNAFTASLAVSVTTFPVILDCYHEVPVYSVFLNLLVIPLMTFLMISAVAGGIIGLFCVPVGAFCVGAAHYVLVFYEWICNVFLRLPFSVVILGKPSALQIVSYYLLLAVSVICIQKSRKVLLVSVCAAVICMTVRMAPDFMVRILDVGQGDGIHVSSDGINMLVDGGSTSKNSIGEYCLIPYLKSQGVRRIDYMVMTHADADHMNGLLEIIEDGQLQVGYLILPRIEEKSDGYKKMEHAAENAGITICYIHSGESFECGKIKVKCLHPCINQDYDSENDYSTVLLLSYDGLDVLLTGDVEDNGENEMLSLDLLEDVDVLKAAHHGSRYSTDRDFLNAVQPEIALISCGKNNIYGHPHEELMQRLEDAGAQIYVTARDGAITVTKNRRGIQVDTFLNP